jgi:hypothetical protein
MYERIPDYYCQCSHTDIIAMTSVVGGGGDTRTAEYMYSYCYVLAHCPLTRSHVSFTDLLHTVNSTTQHAQKQYICTVLYSTAWSAPSLKDNSPPYCPISATVKPFVSATTMSRIFIITSDCYNAYYTGLHCHASTFTMPSFVRGILLYCIIMSYRLSCSLCCYALDMLYVSNG